MDRIEAHTHSFVIRIWLEEPEDGVGTPRWRGHITHSLTGERRYLQDLDDVSAFIAPYIAEMGGGEKPRPSLWGRLWSWCRR
jgi:hypothetical protein